MQPDVRVVLDLGAGAAWAFPIEYKRRFGIELIGLDIDGGEMAVNGALDRKLVGDVCARIELDDGSVDLATAYSGVEHFHDNAAFLRNTFRVLRPGGRLVCLFPSRYAPFAQLNRFVPAWISKKALTILRPDEAGHLGFKAHYDRTNYRDFRKIAEEAGFEVEYVHFSYFNSYFSFFVPLYVLSMAYGLIRMAIGARDHATYNLFVLRKPGPPDWLTFDGRKRRVLAAQPYEARVVAP